MKLVFWLVPTYGLGWDALNHPPAIINGKAEPTATKKIKVNQNQRSPRADGRSTRNQRSKLQQRYPQNYRSATANGSQERTVSSNSTNGYQEPTATYKQPSPRTDRHQKQRSSTVPTVISRTNGHRDPTGRWGPPTRSVARSNIRLGKTRELHRLNFGFPRGSSARPEPAAKVNQPSTRINGQREPTAT